MKRRSGQTRTRVQRCRNDGEGLIQGTTLPEVLLTVVLVGVLAAISGPNLLQMGNNPLDEGINRLAGQLRLARAKAIAQSSAYRIRWTMLNPGDPEKVQTQFIVERAQNCNDTTWTKDPTFTDEDITTKPKVELIGLTVNSVTPPSLLDPNPSEPAQNWKLCINSRGLADKDVQWTLRWRQGAGGPVKKLEIFPGGAIQVYDN
ncbi:MAG TPA: prepilin-type N-terminal cleavage/methylation domain-containing protein [Stenomitos sp.]